MMTRIRYKKEGSVYTSTKAILAGSEMVVVNIIPSQETFTIATLEDGRVLTSGKAKNFVQLKIKAKKALKDMGVQFSDETRDRSSEVIDENPCLDIDLPGEFSERVGINEDITDDVASDDAPELEETEEAV